jgi:hypothetical protein
MSTLRQVLAAFCTLVVMAIVVARTARCAPTPSTPQVSATEQATADLKAALFGNLINEIKKAKAAGNAPHARALITQEMNPYMLLAADPSFRAAFGAEIQEWRTDVQTGSPASSTGTTSLVSKGSVPSLLGLAVEDGALTQTASGTSVTFRTNPTGLISALQKHGYAESGPASYKDPVVEFVSKVSAAITFNTGAGNNATTTTSSGTTASQGSQAQGILTGSAQQISSFDFRYDIYNHRDPRDNKYVHVWEGLRNRQLKTLGDKVNAFANQLKGILSTGEFEPVQHAKFQAWEASAQAKIDSSDANAAATAPNSVDAVVLSIADDFVKTFGNDPAIKAAADAAGRAFSGYLTGTKNTRNMISSSPIVTLEYTDTRQATMATTMSMASASESPATPGVKPPDLSDFKLIIAGGTVWGATLTGNASLTLFNSNPQAPEKGRVRDFQLSGQFDVPLREIQGIGVPTLTFAGLYLSLRQQPLGTPVQVNGVNVDLKGNMGFAQAKISFPVKKGSGVNVPLSFTYASRTELNKEHDVRGSIGMTLDLDTVFASLKP